MTFRGRYQISLEEASSCSFFFLGFPFSGTGIHHRYPFLIFLHTRYHLYPEFLPSRRDLILSAFSIATSPRHRLIKKLHSRPILLAQNLHNPPPTSIRQPRRPTAHHSQRTTHTFPPRIPDRRSEIRTALEEGIRSR